MEFIIFGLPNCPDYNGVLNKQVSFEVIAKHTENEARAVGVANWLDDEPVLLYSEDISEKYEMCGKDVKITPVTNRCIDGNTHNFVMTDEKGKKLFCTWQTYYEKGQISCSQNRISFLNFGKKEPVIRYFYIPKKICLISSQPLFKQHEQILNIFSVSLKSQCFRTIFVNHYKGYSSQKDTWDHISLNAEDGLDEQYVVSSEFLFSFLISIIIYYPGSPYKSHTLEFESQLETKLQIRPIINSLYTPLCELPKKILSSQNFEKLITAVLSESQIIVFASQTNEIVKLFEFIFDMIKPFEWQLTYVPVITPKMFDIIDSFMPYIIGIDSKHKVDITSDYDISHKIIVDLDANTIENGSILQSILPSRVKGKVVEAYEKSVSGNISIKHQFDCKHFFIKLVLELCKNLREGLTRNQSQKAVFSEQSFLKSISKQQVNFYESFLRTMMFTIFKEKMERTLNNETICNDSNQKLVNDFLRLLFLKRDAFAQNSMHKFIEAKLDRIKRTHQNPIRLSLYNSLIKYLYQLNNLQEPYLAYHTFINIFEQPTPVQHVKKSSLTNALNQKLFVTKKYITHNFRPR